MDTDDDWLSVDDRVRQALIVIDPEKPADATPPSVGADAIVAGADAVAVRAKFLAEWESLTEGQRVFLNTWRECRFNANKAMRVLTGTQYGISKGTVTNWLGNPAFEHVRTILRSASVAEILNRDNLAARHDDIVETLLTPKPVLHQGTATGYFEVEAGAAGRANEVLMKLGGHLKEKEVEVNVGVAVHNGPPTLNIQVLPRPEKKQAEQGVAIDAKFTKMPSDDEWLDT